ncbi:uncharacterized protein METZ01_LOCUS316840 [marine metagenome]|uniref:Uncharacterized protein n=1 Tax=marine metagenome TaxID=408172 RepID=A0A382NSC0_9ZZZZ
MKQGKCNPALTLAHDHAGFLQIG